MPNMNPLTLKVNKNDEFCTLREPFSQLKFNLFDDDNILDKKTLFLNKLYSKVSYKRYLGSPLRYGGGKSLGVGNIIEFLPANITRVVSPFIG
jgi:hypothetical protein